jgi:prepilin-type N-terminal cleavage/methylation domain-containing protein
MKKSFTLIELIIVIVILAILSSITFDILSRVYKNYIQTRELNKLNAKLDSTIEIISTKLSNRIKNSVIVTKYPVKLNQTDSNQVDFKSIADIKDDDKAYKVLEWIGQDYEAKNGIWDSNTKHLQTGWSGFVDLGYQSHKTQDDPKEFNITTIDSNFTIINIIDRNITASYGFNQDPFESNTTTLIFSGNDLGGDIVEDLNQSYGWYLDSSKQRDAKAVFAIQEYNSYKDSNTLKTDLNISSITENNDTTLYSRYFIARSAYAIVPIENNETLEDGRKVNDYNITFVYNYQPWQGDWWNGNTSGHGEANSTLLATHITELRFKKDLDTPVIRLYICIQSPNVEVNSTRYLTLCKEKAIY